MMQKNNIREFILVKKETETEDVTSLYFQLADGLKFDYIPGQYVNIRPKSILGHGKSYTISSIPQEEFVCITIKRKGEVSSAVIDLKIGDRLTLEGPYGNFYSEEDSREIVMISGGIGITPFFSIIKSKFESKKDSKITLFYSNKTLKQITFFNELNKLSKDNLNFKIVYCLTEENKLNSLVQEYSRIDKEILNKYLVSLTGRCYYVCGSVGFVKDMWKLLKKNDILEEDIFTETFF